MKKKGFTLIELLAVIIILAIIALIATPIVLNVVNEARESANDSSVKLYVHTIELEMEKRKLLGGNLPSECSIKEDGNLLCGEETVVVEMGGTKPTGGSIHFSNGSVTAYNVTINGKEYQKENTLSATDESCFVFADNKTINSYTIASDCETTLVDMGIWYSDEDSKLLCAGEKVDGKDLVAFMEEFAGATATDLETVGIIDIDGTPDGTVTLIEYNCGGILDLNKGTFTTGSHMDVILPKTINYLEIKSAQFNMDKCMAVFNNENTCIGYSAQAEQLGEQLIPTLESMVELQQFFDIEYDVNANKKTVTSIGRTAFSIFPAGLQGKGFVINSIKLPDSVTHISCEAFSGNKLMSITLPNSVESIGPDAFYGNQFPDASAITIEGDATRFDDVWEDIGFPAK